MGDSSSTVVLPAPSSPRMNVNGDNIQTKEDNEVCTGQKVMISWNSTSPFQTEDKTFHGIVISHNGTKIAFSPSLTCQPQAISSDQFKGRFTLNSAYPCAFTLENATKVDNGWYTCTLVFGKGYTSSVRGKLVVRDFQRDDSLVTVVNIRECVILSCIADLQCNWIYPNGTKESASKIHYCHGKFSEKITLWSLNSCKFTTYTIGHEPFTKLTLKPHQEIRSKDYQWKIGVAIGCGGALICVLFGLYHFRRQRRRQGEAQGRRNVAEAML